MPEALRRRGFGVAAGVIAGLAVLVLAGRWLALPSAGAPDPAPSVMHTGTVRYVAPPPGTPPEPPPVVWSIVPAASSGRPSHLTAGPIRLTLPSGWYGRATSDGGVLLVQAANFPLPARDVGEELPLTMTPGEVLLGLSDEVALDTAVSTSPTIGASHFLHDGRVPVGRALARTAVRQGGMVLSIEALFGSRHPPRSLIRQTNEVLTSLRLVARRAVAVQ
jgi:hypothetical protein